MLAVTTSGTVSAVGLLAAVPFLLLAATLGGRRRTGLDRAVWVGGLGFISLMAVVTGVAEIV